MALSYTGWRGALLGSYYGRVVLPLQQDAPSSSWKPGVCAPQSRGASKSLLGRLKWGSGDGQALHRAARPLGDFAEDTERAPQDSQIGGTDVFQTESCQRKPRLLAKCRWSGGFASAAYEHHLCRLVLTFSPKTETPDVGSGETAAASEAAGGLLRALSVCEAAEGRASVQGHLDASAVSALVDYAFVRGSERNAAKAAARPAARQTVSLHLPSLSPSALFDLVFLCAVRLGVKDKQFLEEASQVALWQLETLRKWMQPESEQTQKPDGEAGDLDGFSRQVVEAPLRYSPRPSAHRIIKLLRGLVYAGRENPRLFDAAAEHLAARCTYTHSDLLHALALLKDMKPSPARDTVAKTVCQRLLLREQHLPLCVVASASNVFSRVQLPAVSNPTPPTPSLGGGCGRTDAQSPSLVGDSQSQCGPRREGHAAAPSSDLSHVDLFKSLSRSAKKAFEAQSLGAKVGPTRGRDLALLARGFVRARQRAAAAPWVAVMDRQWAALRPSIEPHSLSLLLVSLSKLQNGLP